MKRLLLLLLLPIIFSCNKEEKLELKNTSDDFPNWNAMKFEGVVGNPIHGSEDLITGQHPFGKLNYLGIIYKFTVDGEKVVKADRWYYPITITGSYTTTHANIGKNTTGRQSYFIGIVRDEDGVFASRTYVDSL